MLTSIAIILAISFIFASIFEKIKLPGLLGMILVGIVLGPYGLNFISKDLLNISSELRNAALIVILIRAGLGLKRETLNKIGIPALKMSFIPGILEGIAVTVFSHFIFKFSWLESGILGFIIAAVSPAVVVPQMLDLKEKGYGENKEVPTLILAGASVDDVFAITIFGSLLGIRIGENVNLVYSFLSIPISIILGLLLGFLIGFLLVKLFKSFYFRDTKKALIFLVVAILFKELESRLTGIIPIASLLGIMAIGFIILELYNSLATRLAVKFNKIWIFAEILLFVLIGAQVNISIAFKAGILGLIIIVGGLIFRSLGVWISLLGSHLNYRERLFCVFAYLPKATVQAAIGAIPLQMGINNVLGNGIVSGELILAMAVLSIIITAPIGAILIRNTAPLLLKEKNECK